MTTYKLIYFPVKGLGEPIRFMLSYLEKEFEDFRFKMEDFPALKPSLPLGKVPVLEIDGKQLHQTTAIMRYLGKKANLAGKNDWEALQIDIAVDTYNDFRIAVAGYYYEANAELKEKKKPTVLNETAPFYLEKFDEMVKNNNGYLANGALSWGDIFFVAYSDYLNHMLGSDIFEKYSNLRILRDNVLSIPSIKSWIKKRPKTDY